MKMVKEQKEVFVPNSNRLFVRDLKKLNEDLCKDEALAGKSFKKFLKLSASLSSRLPNLSDTTISEVDDILYPKEDIRISSSSGESKKELIKNGGALATSCFQLYHNLYTTLLMKRKRPHIQILDNTYLQLMENTTEDSLRSESLTYSVTAFLFDNIQSRYKIKIGIGLKLMKVAIDKDRSLLDGLNSDDWMRDYTGKFVWLSNLQKIPQAKDPQQKRFTAWFARQSTAIFSKFDLKSIQFDSDMGTYYNVYNSLEEENLDANYINLLLRTMYHENYFMFIHLDHLHSFFMSAKYENEKLKRLEDFLKGTYMSFKKDDVVHQEEDMSKLFESKMYSIVKAFNRRLGYLFYSHFDNEEHMQGIERYQKYKIKPYLSEGTNSDPHDQCVAIEEGEDSDDVVEDIDYKIMPDYTIEKFFFYDEFMRSLELMSIIRTALAMHETIYKNKTVNEAVVFRSTGQHKKIITNVLVEGGSCGCTWKWNCEVIMRECFFLILPDDLHHMKQDIIKLLKGYDVDIATQESIYFAANSFVEISGTYDHTLDDF